MKLYVNCNAVRNGDGTKEKPFKRIGAAADIAMPGDEVVVAPGIYREDVNPINAGKENNRIVYRSEKPLEAVITGADRFDTWELYEGDTWKLTVPNSYFGAYNPYTTLVSGDWLDITVPVHTGEVFLNGKSMYEKDSLEKVLDPEFFDASWDRDYTKHTWFTCQSEDSDETVIYANFLGKDPNKECVEINVRPHCFWPVCEHVDYITLSGFTVTKAATQWAPPTALQEGMIGPHWSKGWIIEDCDISESKCSGISLGKYRQQGNDNKWLKYKYKDGTQTQRDCSFIAQLDGWSKETIGSHIVRNCNIHDCGQTGIVGNLGCVFSVIENNHIHHINNKRNLAGAEIGGIKFHAAIDVIIRNNHFHDCVRGIWLDWQCQGTRVSSNLFHDNCMSRDHLLKPEFMDGLGMGEDLWIEIAHGPTLVDNNIMLSERCVRIPAQGVAFVHNLFYGSVCGVGRGVLNGTVEYPSPRYTPIHKPHSTSITGVMTVLHGDVRFYNNIFVQPKVRQGMIDICDGGGLDGKNPDPEEFRISEKLPVVNVTGKYEWDEMNLVAGTVRYSGYMKEDEWKSCFEGYGGEGSSLSRERFYIPLPVWTGGNVFFNGAKPCDIEEDYTVDTEHEISIELKNEDGKYTVETNVAQYLPGAKLICSDTLGEAFEPEERFENPDGSDIVFDADFYGVKRSETPVAGPFA
ncbi:MAG: right-handed parallel beta-helix repeat-containing protein [Lachnospiraceae bacterium]|nr:right-handed parallel beta-helix repeat-containing protein [Lachnospiraceae bacterium]